MVKVHSVGIEGKKQTAAFPDQSWNTDKTLMIALGQDEGLLRKLRVDYPKAKLVGATTSGNILNDRIINEGSVVSFVKFDKTELKTVSTMLASYEDSFAAGVRLFNELNSKPGLKGIMVFTEGLLIHGENFSKGVASVNDAKVPVIGGLAADNLAMIKTFVVVEDKLVNSAITACGFYGDSFGIAVGSRSGVDSFGVEKKVTKAVANVVYEVDGEPIAETYCEYLGKAKEEIQFQDLLIFPVEISDNFEQKEGLLRTPIGLNPVDKSVTFTGEIKEGASIRLMIADTDALIKAAKEVSKDCIKQVPPEVIKNNNYLSFMVTCSARKAFLSNEVESEIRPSCKELGVTEDNQVGFYSYGELVDLNNECSLVNQTMSQALIYEK